MPELRPGEARTRACRVLRLMHRRCRPHHRRRVLLWSRGLGHSTTGTENPRVGGSIPPLGIVFRRVGATFRSRCLRSVFCECRRRPEPTPCEIRPAPRACSGVRREASAPAPRRVARRCMPRSSGHAPRSSEAALRAACHPRGPRARRRSGSGAAVSLGGPRRRRGRSRHNALRRRRGLRRTTELPGCRSRRATSTTMPAHATGGRADRVVHGAPDSGRPETGRGNGRRGLRS